MIKWVPGRQGSGYFNKRFFELKNRWFGMDCYLIKYPKYSLIPWHNDPVKGHRHYRMNLVLKSAKGGKFRCYEKCIVETPRLIIFRPDIQNHKVTRVDSGTRYVLSFGLAVKD